MIGSLGAYSPTLCRCEAVSAGHLPVEFRNAYSGQPWDLVIGIGSTNQLYETSCAQQDLQCSSRSTAVDCELMPLSVSRIQGDIGTLFPGGPSAATRTT